MKIRSGFVSNSSSSSFIIGGYVLTPKEFADILDIRHIDDVYEYIDNRLNLSWAALSDGKICVGENLVSINYDEGFIDEKVINMSEVRNDLKKQLREIDDRYEFVIVTGNDGY